jgi:hypothetical protein
MVSDRHKFAGSSTHHDRAFVNGIFRFTQRMQRAPALPIHQAQRNCPMAKLTARND